ncbi:glycoside hydrolase family 47 protein [Schizopora paradoxa]|uniref:alpha-1,2-Mannosidase n=1 Tax=Schizopora paradoxa TaxID=27342 RepID=A0A0H2RW59_9AGAM|nr:glycoside hydrolase family 47 protein [Schizopora paradoxa]
MLLKRAVVLAVTMVALPNALAQTVQKPGLQLPSTAAANKQLIVKMFTSAFDAYTKFAFGHDDLQPVSETFNDELNGFGASIVDAMDTALIMGLDDIFNTALNFSSQISFAHSPITANSVSVFENTIRFVGGFLSAFELSGNQHTILVEKAKELADQLAFAWVGDNDIPFGHLDFSTTPPTPLIATSNIAEAGSLDLEWFTLSKFTGNDTYRNLTEKSVRHMIALPDPLPGLPGQCIDPSTGESDCAYVTWGGGSDSYFEYLVKYQRLTGMADQTFINTWRTAVDSSIKTLRKVSTVGDHVYLADFDDDGLIRHIGSHLACFHGGNWLLGGKLLNNNTIVDVALDLVDACWNTYQSTATGIGPETFAWISSDGNFTGGDAPAASDLQFYKEHGFYIFNGGSDYILRPEVLESNFYAWRVTGDIKYQQRAAAAAQSFQKFLTINGGFSGLNNVDSTATDADARIDDQESFFFAEVMKYLFLTFDDPEHISLDNFVFNTEAHPFPVGPVQPGFGSQPLTTVEKPKFTATATGAIPAISSNPSLPKQIEPLIHGLFGRLRL